MKNYHTHTKRCGHAFGEDEDYVRAAIRAGFEEIGFSDHAPMIFPNSYKSNFRMALGDSDDYVKSVRAMQEKYKDKISIKLGFELEYYPALFDKILGYLKQYDYDYLILGQHYVGNEFEEDSHYSGDETKSTEYLYGYVNQSIEGLSTGEFAYIAHPDLIKFTGDNDEYVEAMTYFCREVKKLGCPMEFNMLGYTQKRSYPDERFWKIVSLVGNDVIIGFDAHSPDVLKNRKVYNNILAKLEKLGINPIDTIEFRK